MVYNKIYAQIGEERHITLDPINYQYDVKQILVISGETVPEYYEADICNVGDTATLTMIGTAADGVEIPDRFLLDGRNVLVYVVIPGSGGDVQTRYDITIPVDERAERTDIELDTDQQTQADSLIAALNSGVGRAEAAVTHYPKIVDGYWYVWNSETETWVNTGIRAEGQNGYSPEVTITEIEGGHRVTITDEDHPQGQTFAVMDGQGGSTGDYDELTNRPRINGHTLTGNQSAADLGLGTYSKPASGIQKTDLAQDVQASLGKADTALQTAPVTSVNSKTGAVTLGAGDIGYDGTETYQNGTAGAALNVLNRQLSDLEDTVSTTQIINSASGAIASFDDGADGQPIRKLVAQIEPVQAGSGDPSPDNVRPISGHTGAEIEQTGGNVWDEETELGYWNVRDGSASGSTSELRSKNFIPVTPNTQYYFNKSTDNRGDVLFFGKDQEYLHDYVPSVANRTFTTPDNCYYIKINFGNQYGAIYNHDVSINYPATATSYVPYTGNQISVTFPETIYAGKHEVIGGELTDDSVKVMLSEFAWRAGSNNLFFAYLDSTQIALIKLPDTLSDCNIMCNKYKAVSYGSHGSDQEIYMTWIGSAAGNIIYVTDSRFTTLADFTASITDDYIIAKRATPVEYTLTGNEMETLYGTNNIWANTGDTEVTYPADTKLYIDNKITQAIAAALNA